MFYLIHCDSDKSLCTVKQTNIVHDNESPPGVDDHVKFYWGKNLCTGYVKDLSEDAEQLKKLANELRSKRSRSDSPSSTSPLPKKRLRKPKKVWSFEQNNPEDFQHKSEIEKGKSSAKVQKKKGLSAVQQQVKGLIYKKESSVNSEENRVKNENLKENLQKSPSKEELKRIIQEKNELLKSIQSSLPQKNLSAPQNNEILSDTASDNSDCEKSLEMSGDEKKGTERQCDDQNIDTKLPTETTINKESEENLNSQLFGKNWSEPMVLLKDNVYCKKSVFDDAESNCQHTATSFMRRLMDGVFKRSAILNCTYSGRPPRAQGKERQSEKCDTLDKVAKIVVQDYCESYAVAKGWPKPAKRELRNAMSQWLGEVKRAHKENLIRN